MPINLTYQDLVDAQSLAREAYVNQAVQLDIPGMPPGPLPERERRALAWIEAALKIVGRHGIQTGSGPLVFEGDIRSVWEA